MISKKRPKFFFELGEQSGWKSVFLVLWKRKKPHSAISGLRLF